MPVRLDPNHATLGQRSGMKWPLKRLRASALGRFDRSITVGLINNMPDGALEATERQFLSLLNSASDGIEIRLSFYAMPGVPRGESGVRHVNRFYSSTENLLNTHLDGLIVTGREPLSASLVDEPYWGSFTEILEWAQENTCSTAWSCLAAHAALLRIDGIARIRSERKHFGVFDCIRVADHPLTAAVPARLKHPHSRWNGIPEDTLMNYGYSVLTRTADAGVDTFVKQKGSLFVFLQGHPEYESDTLLLEYRRDVGRYLRAESDTYPSMPRDYFDRDTVVALSNLQKKATVLSRGELRAEISLALNNIRTENTWNSTAACIYRNWLGYLCVQKELRRKGKAVLRQHPLSPEFQVQTLVPDRQ